MGSFTVSKLSKVQRNVLARMAQGDSLTVVAYTEAWLRRRTFFGRRSGIAETRVWISTVHALEDRKLIERHMSEVSRNAYYTLTTVGKKIAEECKGGKHA